MAHLMAEEEKGCEGEWESGRSGEWEKRKIVKSVVLVAKNNITEINKSHRELIVYKLAFKSSMEIFALTISFPKKEVISLTETLTFCEVTI